LLLVAFLLDNAPNCHLSLVLASVVQGDAVNCSRCTKCFKQQSTEEGCRGKSKSSFPYHQNYWILRSPAVLADLISCISIYKICERDYFTKAKDFKWISYDKQLLCPWPYR